MKEGIKNIVWLASYPKSGNTWFRIFLQNILSGSKKPISINQLNSSIISSDRLLFDNFVGTNSSDLTADEINRLKPIVFENYAHETSGMVYIKVHDAWELNKILTPIFPVEVTKAVLYFVRNPLEIACSLAHHSNEPIANTIQKMNDHSYGFCTNTYKLYNQLQQNLLTWSEHVISWTKKSNLPISIIRYEDMLNDTYNTFLKALEFIGLDYSKEQILRAIKNSNFKILMEQEQNIGFKEKMINSNSFFRNGGNGTWKKNLTQNEIKSIVQNHRVIMKVYGYLPDTQSNIIF